MISTANCIGCGRCVEVCPTKCLSITRDNQGFLRVAINENECIKCNKCEQFCINCSALYDLMPPKVCYSAYAKNRIETSGSSSGGLFYHLAKAVIKKGGVAFGATFDENKKAKHILVSKISDVKDVLGAKYIQSDFRAIFPEIISCLSKGKPVLFCGTPCQVAVVRSEFGNNENLFLIDLICHGIASPLFFDSYVLDLERKKKSQLLDLKFRSKNLLITQYGFESTFKNGTKKLEIGEYTPFGKAFLGNYILRDSCYACKFSCEKRVGDITLGDFWGGNTLYPDFYSDYGTSAALINTNKGQQLFDLIKNNIEYIAIEYSDIVAGNKNLKMPSSKNEKYDDFWNDYLEKGYRYVSRKYLSLSIKEQIKKILYKNVREK